MGQLERHRARALPRLLGVITIALAACSYGSVRTAGDVAGTLPEHVGALEDAASYCQLGAASSGDVALAACDDFAQVQPIYTRAARELASYGVALKELSGVSAIPTADLVSGLVAVGDAADIKTLEGDDSQAFADALRLVVDVFADGYKKRNLRRAVTETDRAVQCVVHRQLINLAAVKQQIDGFEQDLRGELDDLEILAEKYDAPAKARAGAGAGAGAAVDENKKRSAEVEAIVREIAKAKKSATRARRDVVRARRVIARDGMLEVARARRRLEALERGLAGFAAAHHTLACAPESIGSTRDGELADDVLAAVRCATTSSDGDACGELWAEQQRARSCEDVGQAQPRCTPPASSAPAAVQ